jgi:hypothetical protein
MIQWVAMQHSTKAYLEAAAGSPRDRFVADYPYLFLVGMDLLHPLRERAKTASFEVLERTAPTRDLGNPDHDHDGLLEDQETDRVDPRQENPGEAVTFLALRKVTPHNEGVITVGRASMNDLVIADGELSRFHAGFRLHPDRVLLEDLGSANGTMVDGRLLEPKGPPAVVSPGSRLRFATLEFQLLDAQTAWDRARTLPR